jgi:hypothetical protein
MLTSFTFILIYTLYNNKRIVYIYYLLIISLVIYYIKS